MQRREQIISTDEAAIKVLKESDEFTPEDVDTYYCPEMLEYCTGYAIFVYSEYQKALKTTPDAILMVETSIDISMYGEGMKGTTDAAIVSDSELAIFDFKYGKGVKVEAAENTQMMIYALGNIARYEVFYLFENVTMHIYQPRMDNCSTYTSTATELKAWGEEYLKPRAEAAMQGEGEYTCGDWCRFCPARTRCKKIANTYYNVFNIFADKEIPTLTDAELVDVVRMSKDVTKWYDAVSAYVLQQMRDGQQFDGLKLVEGRSRRTYSDEAAIAEILVKNGFSTDDIYIEPRLKGLTDMQKLLKKKVMDELIGGLIIKSPGAPTIADISDNRSTYNDAKSDFENLDINV